nr:IQ motif and SEC7 domain-containing protein 1-like [Neomonachus schauinslandi]
MKGGGSAVWSLMWKYCISGPWRQAGCWGSRRTSTLSPVTLVEGEAPSSETGTSLDSPSAYHQGPLTPASSLSPDRYEHTSVGAYGLYSGPPGQQQRTRRPKLQHSTSILRKQAEEEAIKRSRSLSESYELSSDLQDKQSSSLSFTEQRSGPDVAPDFQEWCRSKVDQKQLIVKDLQQNR